MRWTILFNIVNNAGRNLVTPDLNNAPRNYVPAVPSQPSAAPSQLSAGAPGDPGWDEVDELLNMANNAGQNLATPNMNNAPRD